MFDNLTATKFNNLLMAAKKGDLKSIDSILTSLYYLDFKYVALEAAAIASESGYTKIVKLLLNSGLIVAIRIFNKELIDKLLLRGADLNYLPDCDAGMTALMEAVKNGRSDTVEFLLGKGVDVDQRDNSGKTALARAAENGHRWIVKLLLKSKADPACQDNSGKTALARAAENGHKWIVKLLFNHGLEKAAKEGDIESVQALLAITDAKFIQQDNFCETAFEAATDRKIKELLINNALKIAAKEGCRYSVNVILKRANYFIDHHGYFNSEISRDNLQQLDLESAVKIASECGHAKVVKLLLSEALRIAVIVNNTEAVKVLLARGADCNYLPNHYEDNYTVLMEAERNDYKSIIKLLKEKIDINNSNKVSVTALTPAAINVDIKFNNLIMAAKKGDIKSINSILENLYYLDFKYIALEAATIASESGYTKIVKLLLNSGLIVAIRNFNRKSIDSIDSINKLLLRGADLNYLLDCDAGMTALMEAVKNDRIDTVEFLLEKGVDVDQRDNSGKTALIWAAETGSTEIVKLLLKSNADTACQDNSGKTALTRAVENGHEETVKLFLNIGTDINQADPYNFTALKVAAENGYKWIVKLLFNHGLKKAAEKGDIESVQALFATTDIKLIQQDNFFETAFKAATDRKIKELLVNNALKIAAKEGCRYSVNVILKRANCFIDHRGHFDSKISRDNLQQLDLELAIKIASECGHAEVVKLLLSEALRIAVIVNNREAVKVLLARGADCNYIPNHYEDNYTVLMEAARNNCVEIVELLLNAGANVYRRGRGRGRIGETPLMIAAIHNGTAVINLLLSAGADISQRNSFNKTALQEVGHKGELAAKLLFEHELIMTALRGNIQSVQALLVTITEFRIYPFRDCKFSEAIFTAAKDKKINEEMRKLLLSHALKIAVKEGNLQLIDKIFTSCEDRLLVMSLLKENLEVTQKKYFGYPGSIGRHEIESYEAAKFMIKYALFIDLDINLEAPLSGYPELIRHCEACKKELTRSVIEDSKEKNSVTEASKEEDDKKSITLHALLTTRSKKTLSAAGKANLVNYANFPIYQQLFEKSINHINKLKKFFTLSEKVIVRTPNGMIVNYDTIEQIGLCLNPQARRNFLFAALLEKEGVAKECDTNQNIIHNMSAAADSEQNFAVPAAPQLNNSVVAADSRLSPWVIPLGWVTRGTCPSRTV